MRTANGQRGVNLKEPHVSSSCPRACQRSAKAQVTVDAGRDPDSPGWPDGGRGWDGSSGSVCVPPRSRDGASDHPYGTRSLDADDESDAVPEAVPAAGPPRTSFRSPPVAHRAYAVRAAAPGYAFPRLLKEAPPIETKFLSLTETVAVTRARQKPRKRAT
jgi:hypothetical protein